MKIRRFLPFLLVAGLLFSAARQLPKSLRFLSATGDSNDLATAFDERMRLVAATLPSDVDVVGYIDGSDLDPSIRERDQAGFYLTQYGLAPKIVHLGVDYDWVVGYFDDIRVPREIRRALDRRLGPYSLQSFGLRIYLIHRLGR